MCIQELYEMLHSSGTNATLPALPPINLKLSNSEPAKDPKDLRLFKIDSHLNFPIMHLELADPRYQYAEFESIFLLMFNKKPQHRLFHSY